MISSQPTPVTLIDNPVRTVSSCGNYEFHPSYPHKSCPLCSAETNNRLAILGKWPTWCTNSFLCMRVITRNKYIEKNLCITLVIYQESLHDARSTKCKTDSRSSYSSSKSFGVTILVRCIQNFPSLHVNRTILRDRVCAVLHNPLVYYSYSGL